MSIFFTDLYFVMTLKIFFINRLCELIMPNKEHPDMFIFYFIIIFF